MVQVFLILHTVDSVYYDYIFWCTVTVHLSVIMMRSIIVRYYMNNYRNCGKISVRCWIHKGQPIPLWDVFCEYLWENWPCFNGTAVHTRSSLTIAKPEHKSDIQLTKKDTSCLNLLGELWGVYCEYFGETNRMQAVKTAWCGAMIAVR